MDKAKRDTLLKLVGDVNNKTRGLALVTLEQFFEGNDDAASIWCNLPSMPDPQEVYRTLKAIRDRQDVADVRIMVTQYDGGDDEWPFSDTVFFITSATPEEVQAWLGDDSTPDEIGVDQFSRAERIPVPAGMSAIAAWWD